MLNTQRQHMSSAKRGEEAHSRDARPTIRLRESKIVLMHVSVVVVLRLTSEAARFSSARTASPM